VHRNRQNKLQKPNGRGNPFRVAVTGSAGTGKSMVCRRFERLGVPVIDLDGLARKAVSPSGTALIKIVKHFGQKVMNPDGTLNRRALRRKVVRDDSDRRILEEILHPEIGHLLKTQVSGMDSDKAPFVVVEVPLLFESKMEDAFDAVILVMAGERLQKKRLSKRDAVSEKEAGLLLKTQISDERKIDRSNFVIINTESIKKLHCSVDRIFFILNKKYSKDNEIT